MQPSLNRRHLLALLAAPAFAHLLAACSSDERKVDTTDPTVTPSSGPTPKADEARSALQRVDRGVEAADAAALDGSIISMSRTIWDGLVGRWPDKNLVYSAASVEIALAMAAAGSKGQTSTELYELLHARPDQLNGALNALTANLEALNRGATVTTELANSLWGQRGFSFEQPYLDELAREFGAGMNLVDYKSDPDGARRQINTWVDQATHQRIPELIGEGMIDQLMRLVLVNTIYLKAKWATQFIPELTTDADFTTLDGSTTRVKMMHREASFGYAEGSHWTAVELPYVGDELSMVLVLPDHDTTADHPEISGVHTALASTKVNLSLPRFDIDMSAELTKMFQDLGFTAPFDPDTADFSGITTEDRLYIGFVIHQANITVGEEGTEAAAATAVGMPAGAAPGTTQPPKRVVFDRPFSFWIRHRATDVALFTGRVVDPSGTS